MSKTSHRRLIDVETTSRVYWDVLTSVKKKDEIVSCGKPGLTNRSDKNSNIVTLITIIIMLL